MSLIDTSTLAEYLGIDDTPSLQAHLDMAEALAASALGSDTLELTTRTEVLTPNITRKTLPTNYGPITSVTSLTGINGLLDASRTQFGNWVVAHLDAFAAGEEITAVYVTGWADDDALPPSLLQALLHLAKWVMDGSRSVSAEKLGDWSVGFAPEEVERHGVPKMFSALSKDWRRP